MWIYPADGSGPVYVSCPALDVSKQIKWALDYIRRTYRILEAE